MMKPVKIAILSSVSVHAPNYVKLLPKHERYEWVAMSIDQAGFDRLYANEYIPETVKIYEDDEQMLKAHPEIEAVILCGSNEQTYPEFVLCAKYGIKNIMTMKVPTFFMDQYDEMLRLVRENNMVIQVELEMRYKHIIKRLKEIVDSGVIGNLLSMQINNTTVCVPPEIMPWVTSPRETYGKQIRLKEGDSRFRGGCLTDHPHAFDLARYFTESEFESVYAEVSPAIRKDATIEEGAFVLAKMKNGVVVNIDPSYSRHENAKTPVLPEQLGWEGYPKRVEVDIIMNGDKGSIIADCFHSGVFYLGKPYDTYAYFYAEGLAHYMPSLSEFADAIQGKGVTRVNLDFHRNTMEAVSASYESITTGKVIKL